MPVEIHPPPLPQVTPQAPQLCEPLGEPLALAGTHVPLQQTPEPQALPFAALTQFPEELQTLQVPQEELVAWRT